MTGAVSCSSGQTARAPTSSLADVRIDFVGDPVVFEEHGEKRAEEPENPATRAPRSGEGGRLERKVDNVGCAVTEVCEENERCKGWHGVPAEGRAKVWPSDGDPAESDRR